MKSTPTTLIKDGTLVNAESVERADILIRGDVIAEIGDLAGRLADRVDDASGMLVFPGAVDPHVHFNDEFMGTISVHDFASGTRAAAFGGVTSLIDFANQSPGESLAAALEKKQAEADGRAIVDYGVHPVITRPDEATMAEIPDMVKRGAPSIKCYMTYRNEGLMTGDEDLERILSALGEAGGMLLVHAEDNDLIETEVPRLIREGMTQARFHAVSRPPAAEDKAIRRCIEMARRTGGRLFVVHLASDRGMAMVARAREEGVDVRAETCTHYLIFTDEFLAREDGIKWVCSPPLRSRSIQNALWDGIRDGRICQVSSDDAAYSWEAKRMGRDRFDRCPNGIPGIEPRLTLLYSEGVRKGRLSLPRLVELTAAAPARIFGLAHRKGRIAPGADADLVIFNPAETWVMDRGSLHMSADWSAYDGIEVTGRIKRVFSRGELIVDGEECRAEAGRGRFLHRRLSE